MTVITTSPEGSDLLAALKVETTIEVVDYEGLGLIVAEANNIAQADFLTGLAEGFSRYDSVARRLFQFSFIAGEFTSAPGKARGVIETLRDLANAIEEVSK